MLEIIATEDGICMGPSLWLAYCRLSWKLPLPSPSPSARSALFFAALNAEPPPTRLRCRPRRYHLLAQPFTRAINELAIIVSSRQ